MSERGSDARAERADAQAGRTRRRREQVRRRTVVRRRRVALATIAALAAIAGAAVGARGGGGDADGDAELPRAQGPGCPEEIAGDPARLAGQMLVVRLEGEPSGELVRAARRGEIAGVIVFPAEGEEPEDVGRSLRRLQRAAENGGNEPLLAMIDQEGGGASRFPLAPPQRVPAQLAEFGTAHDARLEGQATGHFLAEHGIGINLAPVIDVPASDDSAMALRAFGDDARQVARLGLAFAAGLADEGTIAVPKHFPGLGRTDVSTDAAPVTIDAPARPLRSDLMPFREAVARGAEMVMLALAAYPAYGSERPAALAPEIAGDLLRDELGFEGVAITDDLEAPAISAAGIGEGRAAVAAASAGSDLLLFALGGGERARAALVRAIETGRLDFAALRESCARVEGLRSRALPEVDNQTP